MADVATGPTGPTGPSGSTSQFTGVAEVYDDLMSVVPYSWWLEYVQQLWTRFDARPHRVLDLACGTGAVLQLLRRQGYDAEGADYSAAMLEVARRKLPPDTRLWLQDVRSLAIPGEPFDSCICLFDSLNYLLELADLQRAFWGVSRHLKAGGTFVFDMNSIRALETGMFEQRGTGREKQLEYEWTSAWEPLTRLCTIQMEFRVREGDRVRVFRETHAQKGYTQGEINQGLVAAGFEVLGFYDAYTTRPPTARSDRYFVVARRPLTPPAPR